MSVNLKKGIQSLKLFYFRKFQNMPKQRDYNSEPSWLITHCCQSPAPGQPSPLCLRPPPSDGCLQELLPCAPSHLPRMLAQGQPLLGTFQDLARRGCGVHWLWEWCGSGLGPGRPFSWSGKPVCPHAGLSSSLWCAPGMPPSQ